MIRIFKKFCTMKSANSLMKAIRFVPKKFFSGQMDRFGPGNGTSS